MKNETNQFISKFAEKNIVPLNTSTNRLTNKKATRFFTYSTPFALMSRLLLNERQQHIM